MGESVPVRCPECLRTQAYAAPVFPCACGSPVAPPVRAGATAEPITHRNWTDEWVTVRCAACGREDDWPHPELGCACGTVLRIPVRPPEPGTPGAAGPTGTATGPTGTATGPTGTAPGLSSTATGSDGRGRSDTAPEPEGPGRSGTAPEDAGPWRVGAAPDGDGGPSGTAPAAEGSAGSAPSHAVEPGSEWFGPGPAGGRAAGPGTPGPAPHRRRPVEPPRPPGPRTFAERYPAHIPLPPAPRPVPARGAFRPVTIRTARDAVAAAAEYLRWLGYRDVVQPEERPASGVDLRAPGLVAQVDPSTRPTGLRAVELLWLNGLSASAASVLFSLAGYTPEARERAAEVGLPLFVLDLTGTPQPVNDAADDLAAGT
ncbi:hypothetical protein [Streptomyces sp. NPDC006477]|uniref:hypothetical protein n=1 Tax=Streptomyces sp. NPDC006477 TaxID=3364747 RepID=UPI0036B968E6